MHEPVITVLMPVYNAGPYVAEAIGSVLQQSFPDFELLIVDDGSTDDTLQVIRSFDDPRIALLQQQHGGVAHALNHGLANARGRYIARFDADDICLPHRLATQFTFLEQNPGYLIVGSDAAYMLENGEHLFDFSCIGHTDEEIRDKLYFYCPFIHSAVMYRKQAVLDAGAYPELAHNFEDYLLWIKIAAKGKLANLQQQLIRVRFNPASVTIDEKWRGARFRQLKREIIQKGSITEAEGAELASIIQRQNLYRFKTSAYYALCAKKFLTDNYQPSRSRSFALQAIRTMPFRMDNYLLLLASFLPAQLIGWLHRKSPNRL
jgi:glycosyltransferase involved in cell wall biosynthesis